MSKHHKASPKIVSLVFSILVLCFAVGFYIFAQWHEPDQPPPGGEFPVPLHTGPEGQAKAGGLVIHSSPGFEIPDRPYSLIIPYGRVGIGTMEPEVELDINGRIRIRGGNPGAGKVLTSDENGLARWEYIGGDGSSSIINSCITIRGERFAESRVFCPLGYTIVGGGFYPASENRYIIRNHPEGNSWRCYRYASSTHCYARCCKTSPEAQWPSSGSKFEWRLKITNYSSNESNRLNPNPHYYDEYWRQNKQDILYFILPISRDSGVCYMKQIGEGNCRDYTKTGGYITELPWEGEIIQSAQDTFQTEITGLANYSLADFLITAYDLDYSALYRSFEEGEMSQQILDRLDHAGNLIHLEILPQACVRTFFIECTYKGDLLYNPHDLGHLIREFK